ncbi:hypothetical protein M885DRAFT_120265 [Pelagophyceae sp. CCMP2097]|nr:hypothetical protein M885DRAFT_120265 [Pelagophyceae sp. CCMP2097]
MAMAFGRRRIVCVLVLCLATVADEGVCVGGLCAGPDFEASVREAHSKRYAEAVTSVARGGLAADAITELEAVLAAVEAEASAAYAAFRATVLGDLGKALATDSRVEEAVAAWRAAVDIWPRTGGDAAPFEAFRNLVQSTMLHAAQFSRRLLVERPQDFLVEAQAALFCEAVGDRAAAAQHLAASAKLLQATPALDDHALAPARRGATRAAPWACS